MVNDNGQTAYLFLKLAAVQAGTADFRHAPADDAQSVPAECIGTA